MKKIILITSAFLALFSCKQKSTLSGPEAVLAQMRADTAWIHQLDSMAQIAIGPGAKCLDPVSHSFSYEGRTWIFNQDWGGVLEIPSDYLIEDDIWQAGLSFHGTRIWSPDSLIMVSFYAGFQVLTEEDIKENLLSLLESEGFTVQDLGEEGNVITIKAQSYGGINYFGRHRLSDENGVEFSISVQYAGEKSEELTTVINMANMYPYGPEGTIFKGEVVG